MPNSLLERDVREREGLTVVETDWLLSRGWYRVPLHVLCATSIKFLVVHNMHNMHDLDMHDLDYNSYNCLN